MGAIILFAAACNGDRAASPSTDQRSTSIVATTPRAPLTARDSTVAASPMTAPTTAPSTTMTTTTVSPSTLPSTPPAPTDPPPPTLPSFDSGTKLVGRDVGPGVYQSAEVTDACYWERLSGTSGNLDEIIVNGTLFGGRALVEIEPRDEAFSSSGCGQWVAWLGGPPVELFGDGDWHVGPQVQPGRYAADGDPDGFGCYWERASGFGHDLDEILASADVFGSEVIVDIQPGDVRFTSSGCGEWARLG